jgi:peptidoglycan L-alanyl-D-glutamate endopeptidase CwlK
MDPRSQKNLDSLYEPTRNRFSRFLAEVQILAGQKGLEYRAICGTRTFEEQAKLYAQGRTKPGKIVTNARPGSSFHNFGLAIDCGVFEGGKYLDETNPRKADAFHREAAKLSAKHGLRWGGDFKSIYDAPHYEVDTKVTLAELRLRKEKNLPLL